MAANTKSTSLTVSQQAPVNLISALFVAVGISALLGLLLAIATNERLATEASNAAVGPLLAFLNNFGIVIPLLLIGFGIYFIQLALKLRQGRLSAAIWAKLYAMWLVVLSIFAVIVTIFNSLSAAAADPSALPILALAILLGAAAGFAYSWLDSNEARFTGEETLMSRDARLAWNLLIPTLAVLIFVAARPLERTFIASLTDQRFAGAEELQTRFVGFDNYARLLGFRIDAIPCITGDDGECLIEDIEVTRTQSQDIEVDPEQLRAIVRDLVNDEPVEAVRVNLLGRMDDEQRAALNAMLDDGSISPAETLRNLDEGEGTQGTTQLRFILAGLYGDEFSIEGIERVSGNTVTATVEITEVEQQIVYPNVREVVGEDYRELGFTPNSTFNLFGQRYVFSARDADFLNAIGNTLFFSAVSVTLELILGMIIALAVNSNFPGRGAMRAAMLVPWAIPTVVSAKLWEVMLRDNQSGVINFILVNTGITDVSIPWLASTDTQIWSLIFVDVWKTTPFMALLLLAGLQVIPKDVYEAADVDGASRVRQFFSITLPLLRPTIAVALVFRTLDAVRAFDVFDVLIGKQLQSMATYNKFVLVENQQFGYASAIGVTMFVIILIFTIVYVRALGVDSE